MSFKHFRRKEKHFPPISIEPLHYLYLLSSFAVLMYVVTNTLNIFEVHKHNSQQGGVSLYMMLADW